ncbi:MAG TPA: hypothetical protein VF002_05480 [Gaiellaceae bacterium]
MHGRPHLLCRAGGVRSAAPPFAFSDRSSIPVGRRVPPAVPRAGITASHAKNLPEAYPAVAAPARSARSKPRPPRAGSHPDGWGGFVLVGPSKTGKTTVAKFVCRLFGLEERQAIRLAPEETPGSLFGRRQPGKDGFRFERPPLFELPFACVDEWDKAEQETRRAASALLLGKTVGELEGKELVIRPTVLVCMNDAGRGVATLHEAYLRRSVVLDTGALGSLLEDIDEAAHRLFTGTRLPSLPLARLRPPAERLPEELRTLLRSQLKANLSAEGWRLADVEAIGRLALGRAALTGGELKHAVLATVFDYLSCAATLGQAEARFALRLGPTLGGQVLLLPDRAAAESETEQRRSSGEEAERQAVAAGLDFEHERELRAASLSQLRQQMGRPSDPEGRALAKTLTRAADKLRGCRSESSLDCTWREAERYLEGAKAWLERREADKQERTRIEAQARADKARELAERKRWQELRNHLAALIPYEDEASLLRELGKLGLARWVPAEEHPDRQAGWLQRAWYRTNHPGHWVDQRGRRASGPAIWRAAYRYADTAVVRLGGRAKPLQPRRRRATSTLSSA